MKVFTKLGTVQGGLTFTYIEPSEEEIDIVKKESIRIFMKSPGVHNLESATNIVNLVYKAYDPLLRKCRINFNNKFILNNCYKAGFNIGAIINSISTDSKEMENFCSQHNLKCDGIN